MAQQKGQVWIGTSGWQYDHWLGVFYPDEYPKKQWFSYYAEHFRTVEVNNTFYHLPGTGRIRYFNNDAKGHAVRNALQLKQYVFGE